jgi:hypothetical protein
MNSRFVFYAIILAVGLLSAAGLGLMSHEGPTSRQAAIAAPLAGVDNGADNAADNADNSGDNVDNGDNVTTVEVVVPPPAEPPPPAPAAPPPVVVVQPAPTGQCFFTLGFADLRNRILAEYGDVVGVCLENEHGDVDPFTGQLKSLDTNQQTLTPSGAAGLFSWQQFTNTMRFTDGFRTWVYSACGLQVRLNTQTYVWETDAAIAAQVVPAPGTCELV